MKRQLYFEVILYDNQTKLWKVTDEDTGNCIIFTVTSVGDVSFVMSANKFPYSKALHELTHQEGRRLHISIPQTNKEYRSVIEKTANVTKVPCNGISFQMYYLNP